MPNQEGFYIAVPIDHDHLTYGVFTYDFAFINYRSYCNKCSVQDDLIDDMTIEDMTIEDMSIEDMSIEDMSIEDMSIEDMSNESKTLSRFD